MPKLSVVTAGDYVADDLAGIEAQAFLELLLCCSLFLALYHKDPNRQYGFDCDKRQTSRLALFWLHTYSADSCGSRAGMNDEDIEFELEVFLDTLILTGSIQKTGFQPGPVSNVGEFLYQLLASIAARMSQEIIRRVDQRVCDERGFLVNTQINDSKLCEGSGQWLDVTPSENPVITDVMVGRQSGNVYLTINPGLSSVAEAVLAELAKKAQPDVANDSGFFDQINTSV